MELCANEIAAILDLSCVRTHNDRNDVFELVETAEKYGVGQVSVLQGFVPLVKQLINGNNNIKLVGNVSFPSGSDSSDVKLYQTKEMIANGCDEIDMVLNVGKLKSGNYLEVEEEVRGVVDLAQGLTVKVIVEMSYLHVKELEKACEICINSGADFIKTGTGWAGPTTLSDVKLLKSIVGESIKIKASGGIRDLVTLLNMHTLGVIRFGVNLKSGIQILNECMGRV